MIAALHSLYVCREQRDQLPFISLSVWRIALQVFFSYVFSTLRKLKTDCNAALYGARCQYENKDLTRLTSTFPLFPLFLYRFRTDSWRSLKSPCMSFTTPSLRPKIQTPPGRRLYTRWSVNWTATSPMSSRRLPIYRPGWRVMTVKALKLVTRQYYFIFSCSAS